MCDLHSKLTSRQLSLCRWSTFSWTDIDLMSVVSYTCQSSVYVLLLRPGRGVEYCDQHVCLCVCLFASISLEPLDRSSRNFVCGSLVAVARSSSGGVALRFVLPVLWMTSRLAVVGRMSVYVKYNAPRGVAIPGRGVWCLWMPCLHLMLTGDWLGRYELWRGQTGKSSRNWHLTAAGKGTQPNFAKLWTVNRANNLPWRSRSRPAKMGAKNLHFFRFFDNFKT